MNPNHMFIPHLSRKPRSLLRGKIAFQRGSIPRLKGAGFIRLATAVLVITAVVVLPNFDGAGAQSAPLSVETTVRNVTRGEFTFQDATNASSGETVQIQIQVQAGTGQSGVIVRNPLPAGLVFTSGESGVLNAGGMAIGGLNAGASRILLFDAQVLSGAAAVITDTAYALSRETAEQSDSAVINVSPAVPSPSPIFQNLLLRHQVLNLTRGETAYKTSTGASVGDRLRFEVYVENQGTARIDGISLRYLIPFGRFVIVKGNANFIISGLEISSLRPGESHTETFEIVINQGSETVLTSIARVFSGAIAAKNASVTITIGPAASAPAVAGLTTLPGQKTISAVNRSAGVDATKVPARPGDVIAFQLHYKNTSSAAENARVSADVRDLLQLVRVSNTDAAVVDNAVIIFPAVNLQPNGEVIHTFEVTVLDGAHIARQTDRVIEIIFGNALFIEVSPGRVAAATAIKPPRTGASEAVVVVLSALTTGGYVLYRKKRQAQLV